MQLLGTDWAGLVLTEGAARGSVLAAQTGTPPTDLNLGALSVSPETMSGEAPAPGTGFRLACPVHALDGPGGWLLVGVRSPRCWTEDEVRALADLVGGELERRAAALALTSERAAFAAQQGALHSARNHLMLALESAPLVLWATDVGGLTLAERRGLERPNSSPGAPVGQTVTEVPGHVPGIRENVQRALNGESFSTNIHLGGRTFEAWCSPLRHPDGRQSGALGVGYDVTELLESQRVARQSQLQSQSQAEVLLELSRVLDVDGDLKHAADAALSVLSRALGSGYMGLWQHRAGGFRAVTLQGEVPETLREYQQRGISDRDRYAQALLSGQSVFLNPHDLPDRVRGLGLYGAGLLPVTLDSATGVLVLGAYRTEPRPWSDFERDLLSAAARTLQVSVQRRHSLRELQQAAHTEPLTGLGNRRAFQADLETALSQIPISQMPMSQMPVARLPMNRVPVTLVAVDLDGLKQVNDESGHHRGDALLQAYGLALQTTFQPGRVYRLGGDEFVVLLTGTDLEGAELRRCMAEVEALVRGAGFDVGASAGAASAPREAQSAADLIRLSDARMYEAKATRRSARHLGARRRAPGNGDRDA